MPQNLKASLITGIQTISAILIVYLILPLIGRNLDTSFLIAFGVGYYALSIVMFICTKKDKNTGIVQGEFIIDFFRMIRIKQVIFCFVFAVIVTYLIYLVFGSDVKLGFLSVFCLGLLLTSVATLILVKNRKAPQEDIRGSIFYTTLGSLLAILSFLNLISLQESIKLPVLFVLVALFLGYILWDSRKFKSMDKIDEPKFDANALIIDLRDNRKNVF